MNKHTVGVQKITTLDILRNGVKVDARKARKMKMKIFCPLAHSLKCLHQPGLGKAYGSQEPDLHSEFPYEWEGPKYMAITCSEQVLQSSMWLTQELT